MIQCLKKCLVVAVGACTVAVAKARHYKRAFHNEVPQIEDKVLRAHVSKGFLVEIGVY